MAISFSNSTPAFIMLHTDLLISKSKQNEKRKIEDVQFAVYERISENVSNIKIFNALTDLDSWVRKLCKKEYRFNLLKKLATISTSDILELHYLIGTKKFFKHILKFNIFYQSLKIKNIKNRHKTISSNLAASLIAHSKLAVKFNIATVKTTSSSNFLLDFGFVESVGSVLLLLKDY